MATEIISKQGNLFEENQAEGMVIFIPAGLVAIKPEARDFVSRLGGQEIPGENAYTVIPGKGSQLRLIALVDTKIGNTEEMQSALAKSLDYFKKAGVRSVAMNGIRCDDRPDAAIRPESYQRGFIEAWLKENPEVFERIVLVDLRGGFNRI